MNFSNTLLVSDIDGTLIGADQQVPQANRDAIAQYCAAGGRFAIASGRTRGTAHLVLDQITPTAPSIFINGVEIYDLAADRPLYRKFLDPALDESLRAYGRQFPDAAVLVFTPDGVSVIGGNRHTAEHDALVGIRSTPITWDTLPAQKFKVLFMADEPVIAQIEAYCAAQRDSRVTSNRSWATYLELLPTGGTKGDALRELSRITGVPLARCIAIGDYDNDAEMLRTAGISAAPANASPLAQAAAQLHVCSCEQGAVADLLARLQTMP